MPSRSCSVPLCKRPRDEGPGRLPFFSFPAHLELRQKWLKALGMKDSEIKPTSRICMLHFRSNNLKGTRRILLNKTAVPEFARPLSRSHSPSPPPIVKGKRGRPRKCASSVQVDDEQRCSRSQSPSPRIKRAKRGRPKKCQNPETNDVRPCCSSGIEIFVEDGYCSLNDQFEEQQRMVVKCEQSSEIKYESTINNGDLELDEVVQDREIKCEQLVFEIKSEII